MTRTVELSWRPSKLTLALATAAALTLGLAVVLTQWQLAVFAAPLVGVLASAPWQRPGAAVRLQVNSGEIRCFEDEPATVAVRADPDDDIELQVELLPVPGAAVATDRAGPQLSIEVRAPRWGRYPVQARMDARAVGGLFVGSALCTVAELCVFPVAAPQPTRLPRTALPDRLGTHLTRHVGPGVEYADVRAYVPGDQLRTVNWPVSARRGSLHVTERLTDRAADVVVLLDDYVQAPGPATAAAERAARGAAQVVQSALRHGDRAGIAALGHGPRWIAPDIGRRQFYRVLAAILATGSEFETTTGTLVPPAALPPGAIVVAFSTLLDTEFALALIDLRRRGNTVVAVDVLSGAPFEDRLDPLLERMWSLERKAMYRNMRTVGVDIVAWDEDVPLDAALHLVPDRRRR